MTKISYIVSTYNDENIKEVKYKLIASISSLLSQTLKEDVEIIVTDNGRSEHAVQLILDNTFGYGINYLKTKEISCYHSANKGAAMADGKWLCFPSDDSYYVPVFAETLITAAEANGWDLVYCDMLYDRRHGSGKYSVMDVKPNRNHIDKTGFIIKHSVFEAMNGFENLNANSQAEDGDGQFIEKCIQRGVPNGKVHEVLVVHN